MKMKLRTSKAPQWKFLMQQQFLLISSTGGVCGGTGVEKDAVEPIWQSVGQHSLDFPTLITEAQLHPLVGQSAGALVLALQ